MYLAHVDKRWLMCEWWFLMSMQEAISNLGLHNIQTNDTKPDQNLQM